MIRQHRRLFGLLMVVVASTAAGCGTGTSSRESFDRKYPYARHMIFGKAELDGALAKLRTQIGGKPDSKVRARFVHLSESNLILAAQDPKRKDHLDHYIYRDGTIDDPRPEKLSDDEEEKVFAALFDLDDVPFDLLPQLLQKAVEECDLEGGHVVGFTVSDNEKLGFTMRVDIEGDRKSGGVTFDSKGGVLTVDR